MRLRRMLAGVAIILPAPAPAAWQAASSRHFVVYANDSPERLRSFTARLERYDSAMHVLRNMPDDHATPASRVTVFVLESMDEVKALKGAGNAAGFYIPRARGSVAFVPTHGRGGPPVGDLRVQNAFYGRAWLLTHYLMSDPARRELLGHYVAAINAGAGAAEAAKLLGDPNAPSVRCRA